MPPSSSYPKLRTTVAALRRSVAASRLEGKRIGLVPTMGALHAGHLSLVRTSMSECDETVVTIFVNPAQFGPNEDLDSYPRPLQADLDALAKLGSPLVFAPSNEEVYRPGHATWVEVQSVSKPWEGECRPEHFRGVTTIVLKLFNLVGADVSYFGQKDFQQSLVIRCMVDELDIPIEVRICPTVREPDGLAMSSRNVYLSPESRCRATALYESLCLAEEWVAKGCRDPATIAERVRQNLSASDAEIEYVAIADPQTLEPIERIDRETLLALAVVLDGTRLIDNCLLRPDD